MKMNAVEVFWNEGNTITLFQSETGFTDSQNADAEDNFVCITPDQADMVCKEIKRIASLCRKGAVNETK